MSTGAAYSTAPKGDVWANFCVHIQDKREEMGNTPNPNPGRRGIHMSRATSSDVDAKLDLLIEAAVARGRVRSQETLHELDQAAIAYHRVARAWTIEREHQLGVCNELSCPFCERAQHEEPEEESA
jgi:hypothetical protein